MAYNCRVLTINRYETIETCYSNQTSLKTFIFFTLKTIVQNQKCFFELVELIFRKFALLETKVFRRYSPFTKPRSLSFSIYAVFQE